MANAANLVRKCRRLQERFERQDLLEERKLPRDERDVGDPRLPAERNAIGRRKRLFLLVVVDVENPKAVDCPPLERAALDARAGQTP